MIAKARQAARMGIKYIETSREMIQYFCGDDYLLPSFTLHNVTVYEFGKKDEVETSLSGSTEDKVFGKTK